MSLKPSLHALARKRLPRMRHEHADEIEADREAVAKGGLIEFMRRAWHQIEPAQLRESWHMGAIAEHLEAVTIGAMTRLIINVPPGSSKTLLCSILWNAWTWTEIPDTRFLYATYSQGLSRRDAVKTRNLVDSEWYRARWPHITIPRQNTRSAMSFENNRGGWRFSTTPKGAATGRHADIHVVDDPSKPRDTKNKGGGIGANLDEVRTWWRETMPSRARDPERLRKVIVMQRLHDLDLAGEMLREGGYEHLRIPMRYESADPYRTFVFLDGERQLFSADPRETDGELLDPVRYPEHVVHDLETKSMGASVAAAQLQQRPNPAGGDIFRVSWFNRRYGVVPEGATWIQSWDLRFKEEHTSGDHVVGGVFAVHGANIYIVEIRRGRWSFLESIAEVAHMSKDYPQALLKLVENKANGPALVNVMRDKIMGLVLVEPHGGKLDRAQSTTDLWEAGNVHLPTGNTPIVLSTGEHLEPSVEWAPMLVVEHLGFPKGAYDDIVDVVSQALNRLREYNLSDYAAGIEALGEALGLG